MPPKVRNTLLHIFRGKSLLNLWRWILLLSSLASVTSCIAWSTESLLHNSLDQPLPISLLASMNLNFSRLLPCRRCIPAKWMTLSLPLATKMSAIFSLTASTRFTLLFALLLKKNLWLLGFPASGYVGRKIPWSSSPPSTGNPHSPVNIYTGIPSVHRNAKLTYLILALIHRALAICSHEDCRLNYAKSSLFDWLMNIRSTLSSCLRRRRWSNFMLCLKLSRKDASSIYVSMARFCFYPVWRARRIAVLFIENAIKPCCSAEEPYVLYPTNELLSAAKKDVLLVLQKSNLIYQISSHCDSRYAGCTPQKLQELNNTFSIRPCSSQKCILPARRGISSNQPNNQYLASDSAN